MKDMVERQTAIDDLHGKDPSQVWDTADVEVWVNSLPSVQPEPISDAYAKAVLTWLIDYQIKAAELKGRYTPYEVLSWVANDWRKEHERSDSQAGGYRCACKICPVCNL